MSRPAASLSVTALDHGGTRKLRCGDDDPDASGLLKNRGPPAWTPSRPSCGRISLTTP